MITGQKKSWLMVVMLLVTATAGYICRVNISIIAPIIMNEFSLSQVQMGQIFSSFLLGYALFQVPSGVLADKYGARKVLMNSLWLWGILTILQIIIGLNEYLSSASVVLFMFIVIRFLLGITISPTYPTSAQGISKWIKPKYQGRANGIVIASVGIGSAIAPPMISIIMVNYGWRLSLFVTAIPVIILAIIWKYLKEPSTINSPNQNIKESIERKSSKNNLKKSSFIFLTISYSLQGYVGYIFVTWFYLYLVQERHFSLFDGALMSSLPWILSIISIPLGGFISDRLVVGRLKEKWGRRLIPIIGMCFSGVLISIGAHTESSIIAALTLALATGFVLSVEGPFWAMMIRISKENSGQAGGIMNMGCNIGGLISPIITPFLASITSWEFALHVAAFLSILSGLMWFIIKPEN